MHLSVIVGVSILSLLLFVSFLVHELSHAFAARRHGIRAEYIVIGGGRPRWRVPLPLPFIVYLAPLPIWAQTRWADQDEDHLYQLPHRSRASILGAGAVANAVMGAISLLVVVALQRYLDQPIPRATLVSAIVLNLGAIILWKFRKGFCTYILAPAGIVIAVAVLAGMIIEITGGPRIPLAGIVRLDQFQSLPGVFMLHSYLTLSLGLTSMLPILPLDGAIIIDAYLWERSSRIHKIWEYTARLLMLTLACTGVVYTMIKFLS